MLKELPEDIRQQIEKEMTQRKKQAKRGRLVNQYTELGTRKEVMVNTHQTSPMFSQEEQQTTNSNHGNDEIVALPSPSQVNSILKSPVSKQMLS